MKNFVDYFNLLKGPTSVHQHSIADNLDVTYNNVPMGTAAALLSMDCHYYGSETIQNCKLGTVKVSAYLLMKRSALIVVEYCDSDTFEESHYYYDDEYSAHGLTFKDLEYLLDRKVAAFTVGKFA